MKLVNEQNYTVIFHYRQMIQLYLYCMSKTLNNGKYRSYIQIIGNSNSIIRKFLDVHILALQ